MIRSAQQILELVDNSKAFVHQSFEKQGLLANKGIVPQTEYITPLQIRVSNLIYLAKNPLASVIQKNKAADELGRLIADFKMQDGVFERNLFDSSVWY